MTETELTDRLREAIVLDGPDVWRTNGYLQDAQQAGLSLTDALKRATEISQEVANNSLLFQNIQARIARLAQPSRAHLIEQDLSQIINAATSLKLSPDFVRNRWVPLVLQRITSSATPKAPEVPVVVPPQPVAPSVEIPDKFEELIESEPEPPQPEPQKITVREPEPVLPPPVVVEQPIAEPVSTLYEPPPLVRSFTATPARIYKGQSVTLAWDVENLLAVTIDDLGEGLSPNNRGWVKPSKSTDYTLFDANNNPLSTVRVEVMSRDRSGVYGVLFAMALLALIYWFIKSSNAKTNEPKPRQKTEQTTGSLQTDQPVEVSTVSHQKPDKEPETTEATDTPAKAPNDAPVASVTVPKSDEKTSSKTKDDTPPASEPEPKPTTPADARQGKYEEAFGNKPYDKVELGMDEHGWRRARSRGRWGYVNEFDEWVIPPEYEAVTPFRGNTASVFRNGQLMTINRSGEQVRN
ncbi:WG repeat-containing protein [Spirosoma litoris]